VSGAGKVVRWLIFTKDSRGDLRNYRPVNLMSSFSKSVGTIQGIEQADAWKNTSGSTPLSFCKGKTYFTSLLAFFLRNRQISGQGVLKCIFKIHWEKKALEVSRAKKSLI